MSLLKKKQFNFPQNDDLPTELIRNFKPIWELALQEDLGITIDFKKDRLKIEDLAHDITTASTHDQKKSYATLVAKEELVVCGLPLIRFMFDQLDQTTQVQPYVKEGQSLPPGSKIATLNGYALGILAIERIMINTLQHLSGIATRTQEWCRMIEHSRFKIYDTRKTLPGYRFLEKYAVKTGGGNNHRLNLNDSYLIKDNHITISKNLTDSLDQVTRHQKKYHPEKLIEIECKNLKEVTEAVDFIKQSQQSIDIIMMDNFALKEIESGVKLIKTTDPNCRIEISGEVDQDKLSHLSQISKDLYQRYGFSFDLVSIGALTHSAPSVDISLDFCSI